MVAEEDVMDAGSPGSETTDQKAFVASCDILGFSNRVKTDFDATLKLYETFTRLLLDIDAKEVETAIFSDSIIMTSSHLVRLVEAVSVLWFAAQTHFFIVRGGIAYGRVWRKRQGHHQTVVSDALIRAVELEKSVSWPAVVIDASIDIPITLWIPRFEQGPVFSPVFYYDGLSIVSPFNRFWFASALGRFETMKVSAGPKDARKFDWLAALHRAVAEDQDLVPQDVITLLISEGVIKLREGRAGASGTPD